MFETDEDFKRVVDQIVGNFLKEFIPNSNETEVAETEVAETEVAETEVAPEVDSLTLWLHFLSEHAGYMTPCPLQTLIEEHDHEHAGPGTIRNHSADDFAFSMPKVFDVLSEVFKGWDDEEESEAERALRESLDRIRVLQEIVDRLVFRHDTYVGPEVTSVIRSVMGDEAYEERFVTSLEQEADVWREAAGLALKEVEIGNSVLSDTTALLVGRITELETKICELEAELEAFVIPNA